MLIIEANYSQKLGLPGYSSHQYSLTLRAEISATRLCAYFNECRSWS